MSDVIASDQLRLLIERIERHEEEKKGLMDDIKDVYAEAKSVGFDTKTIRSCVRLRKMEKHHREEAEALLETYKAALGMDYSSTPLGSATIERAAPRIAAVAPPPPVEIETQSEDQMYAEAVAVVEERGSASTSFVQQHLRVGYNTASKLIERMERDGKVSKPNHVGARTVLQMVADRVNAGALGSDITATVG